MKEQLRISLIGMSNIGKTYRSLQLKNEGYTRYGCDDEIDARLDTALKALGYAGGIQETARWMGYPFDSQYPKTSKEYLDLEEEVLGKILDEAEGSKPDQNIVIDTTGSVIYLPETVLARLARVTRVVYLEAPESKVQEMYEKFIKEPKPVIWGNSFTKIPGEDNMQALARCYPLLLAFRAERYAQLADVTLRGDDLWNPNFTVNKFLEAIRP